MLKLRDIMTRDVLTLRPEATVREAMQLLASRHVSGAPVVSGEKVVGVISSGDLLSFATYGGATTGNRDGGADGPSGLDRWEAGHMPGPGGAKIWLRGEDGLLSGMAAAPATPDLDARTVSHLMTRRLRSMGSDAAVTWAADYMRRERIRRLLVMDNDRLVGIVSLTDIVRAVAEHRLTTRRRYVFPRRSHATSATTDRRTS